MNHKRRVLLGPAAAFVLVATGVVLAADNTGVAGAIAAGKAGIELRARYERVDQDDIPDNANALTARLRLNYRTGPWSGWSAFGEFDYVFHLLDDFNSGQGTSPGRTRYPGVADPEGADLNQLYLDYSRHDAWQLRLGRQRILLDTQRFVGGVGWRQNEQTYDALTFTSTALTNTTLQYSYIGYVRRIFGERSAAGAQDHDTHLLNAKITLSDGWSVTPYVYLIDNHDDAASSSATLGARVAGSIKAGQGKVALAGEFSTQSDAANNPVNYDARYLNFDALWFLNDALSLGVGYESLGGDAALPGRMFRTPLATLHKFQGWADLFLTTPAAGIDDVFATIQYKTGRWDLTGVYHDFSAEAGAGDFGSEFDASAGTKLADNLGILFKLALFSGNTAQYPDTEKFWIMFTASY